MARLGQEVRIAGGMAEFRGRLGTIIGEEGTRPRMYRVRLHEPVEVPGVGMVEDDLWQGAALKAIRRRNGKDKQASLVGYAMAASLHRAFCPRCGKKLMSKFDRRGGHDPATA
jgi:hypothetical protein